MAYLIELGPVEQSIAKQAFREGNPLPERIANAPELLIGLQLYLNAFFDLDSERSHSMGITAIRWSSISDYAQAYEFDEEQSNDLHYLIKQMDFEHLKRLTAKAKINKN